MRVTHQYPKHHYEFEWILEPETYCPRCGKCGCVWYEWLSGDIESPPSYACAECSHAFGYSESPDAADIARQLKTGVQDEPREKVGG